MAPGGALPELGSEKCLPDGLISPTLRHHRRLGPVDDEVDVWANSGYPSPATLARGRDVASAAGDCKSP